MTDNIQDAVVTEPIIEVVVDPIAAKDAEIATLTDNLENYKRVALKRLGKLPGDADFLAGTDERTGLTVEETVKKTLLEGEFAKRLAEKDEIARKAIKEVSELRLALKNRPNTNATGGGSGDTIAVKDNILSEAQIESLRQRAIRLKADPDKFIEKAKANLQKNAR